MVKKGVGIICVLLCICTLFAACSRDKGKNVIVEEPEPVIEQSVRFAYSQDLADAAIGRYFSRDYDTSFTEALVLLDPVAVQSSSTVVQLEARVAESIDAMLYVVLTKARGLDSGAVTPPVSDTPDSPYAGQYDYELLSELYSQFHQGRRDFAFLLSLEDAGFVIIKSEDGEVVDIEFYEGGTLIKFDSNVAGVKMDMSKTAVLANGSISDEDIMRAYFPAGTAPAIPLTEGSGRPSSAFRVWFINTSMSAGFLDSRIYEINKGVWAIDAASCAPEYGGTSFRVFDKTFIVPDEDIGALGSVIRNDPKYTLVMDSYMYFDSGFYRATYVTDPALGISPSVRVAVTFQFTDPGGKEFATDMERFLAGVRGVAVNVQ